MGFVRDGLPATYRITERRRIPAPARCDDLPHIKRRDAFGRPDVVTRTGLWGIRIALGVFSPGRPWEERRREGKGAMMSDNSKRWAPLRRPGSA